MEKSSITSGEMRTGAAYIRVSTDDQMDLSPESQLDEIKKYALNNNILLLPDYIFMEMDGVSGRKAGNRAEFQRMMGTAKIVPKPFDVILVWKFSRFARNQDESTFYKSMLRKKLNIDVISVSEPILEGMYGRLIEMIIEWQDEFYSVNLSAEVLRGMKKNAEKGFYNGKVPFGYRKKPREMPEIEEHEGMIVRKIFDLRDDGYDINYITRYLNESGIKTTAGKLFNAEFISYLLNNPFYIGKVRWNRRTAGAGRRQYKNEEDWVVSDAHHNPIISLEQWEREQNRQKQTKAIRVKYSHPVSHGTHWLSGMVKCSICGKSLSFKSGHQGRINSFQCLGYRNGLHRESQSISERKLTAAVIQSLKNVIDSGEADFECISASPDKEDNLQLSIYQGELKKIAQKEDRILNAYMNGIDTMEEYKKHKQMLSAQKALYENQIAEFSKPKGNIIDARELFMSSVAYVFNIIQSDADNNIKGNALRSIVKSITFYKDTQTLQFVYYLVT